MIELLIILMYITTASALIVTLWSVVRRIKMLGRTSGKVHGIPVRRINIAIMSGVCLISLLAYLLADTQPMTVNATKYDDTIWLRLSNMFVFTGEASIMAAVASMTFCFMRTASFRQTLRNLLPQFLFKK